MQRTMQHFFISVIQVVACRRCVIAYSNTGTDNPLKNSGDAVLVVYEIKTFNVKIMQEVWRCEEKNVFLQHNSVKRLKEEDYGNRY